MRRFPLSLAALLALFAAAVASVARPAGASDDSFFPQQWNLAQIHAADAWPTSTGSGVTIGIVDTGVDSSHPDLAGKIDATANCLGGTCRDGGADDVHGHGTVVSGIAAAVTGNGRGIAGVAPDAHLVVAKAVDDEGRGDVNDILAGIRWVVDHGARVVNLSLGDPNFLLTSLLGTPLRPGIEYAWSHNAVPVLASGNENVGLLDIGSSNYGSLNALVVGATDRTGGVAGYSSPLGSAKWGLVAPGGSGGGQGEDVLSTFTRGRYAWVAGTSMAAPHVAGAVALLLSKGLSPGAAVQKLLSTLDRSVKCGAGCQGRLDLAAAVGGLGPGASAIAPIPTPPGGTTPGVTAAPGTASVTTTLPQGGATTTTSLPTTQSTTDHPERRALAAGPLGSGGGDGSRNPFVVAVAVMLLAASAAATGILAWERLRVGEGW